MPKVHFLGATAAVMSLLFGCLACGGGDPASAGGDVPGEGRSSSGDLRSATLFFPGTGEFLQKEERQLAGGDAEEQIRAIVEALLDGPKVQEARPALPDDTTIGGVYLGAHEVAYLDLSRPDNQPPPPMGSLQETLMVYSFVNSVVLNVQGVERLSLLWNGAQHPSLAGHLSNGGPLEPKLQLAR